jgi:hypothetical protein
MLALNYYLSFFISLFLLSCSGILKSTHNKTNLANLKDSLNAIAAEKGTDFMASGDIPNSWSLIMDYDNYFLFKSGDSTIAKSRPITPETGMHLEEIYHGSSNGNPLDIIIFNSVKNKDKPNNVIIDFNGKNHYGTGNFIYDKRLQRKWILDYIDNEQQFPINFPNGMPFIKFDVDKKKLTGFDSQKKISCNISVKGNRVLFGVLNIDKSKERPYISSLLEDFVSKQFVEFYFKDNSLVLQLNNDMRLRFRSQ